MNSRFTTYVLIKCINISELEHSLAVEKAEYEELTGKYELLEEEHVVTKARLTVEKEQAQG